MRMYIFIFVAFVGSATAFDASLFADKLESFRSEVEAAYASHEISDYEIADEVTTSNVTGCLETERALRLAVKNARTRGPLYTKVDLCTKSLMLSGKIDSFGIDVTSKWLDIRCGLSQSRCALNSQGQSGFFYGIEANIKIDRVDFVKGSSNESPSMSFFNSEVQISNSSFLQNKGTRGSLYVSGGDFLKLDNVTFAENNVIDGFNNNVVLDNIARSSISRSSFKDNKGIALFVAGCAYSELSDVTFEKNSDPTDDGSVSLYLSDVTESNISGALFKSNSQLPLVIYRNDKSLITNSTFDGNYNDFNMASALVAGFSNVILKGVSFVNNILHKKGGNTLGIVYSRVKLDGCTFANNDGPVGSTKSSSVLVSDGDDEYDDGGDPSTYRNTTLMCSKTKFCDGFPSRETIVDQFLKPFDAPTCKASRVC